MQQQRPAGVTDKAFWLFIGHASSMILPVKFVLQDLKEVNAFSGAALASSPTPHTPPSVSRGGRRAGKEVLHTPHSATPAQPTTRGMNNNRQRRSVQDRRVASGELVGLRGCWKPGWAGAVVGWVRRLPPIPPANNLKYGDEHLHTQFQHFLQFNPVLQWRGGSGRWMVPRPHPAHLPLHSR